MTAISTNKKKGLETKCGYDQAYKKVFPSGLFPIQEDAPRKPFLQPSNVAPVNTTRLHPISKSIANPASLDPGNPSQQNTGQLPPINFLTEARNIPRISLMPSRRSKHTHSLQSLASPITPLLLKGNMPTTMAAAINPPASARHP